MKKRLFAALAAAAMLCGVPVNTTSAEETYQMGDVNMDGVVDCADAQLVLVDWVEVMCKLEGSLTAEQRVLGNVNGEISKSRFDDIVYVCDVVDAQQILQYYTLHLAHPDITLEDVTGKTQSFLEAWEQFLAEGGELGVRDGGVKS